MRALLVFSTLLLAVIGGTANIDCKNGGVPKGNECECQSYWKGEDATGAGEPANDCSVIECVNGGYSTPLEPNPTERQVCHCPRGYYGIHCDAVKQARPVEGVFKTKSNNAPHRTFNLYIHNELTDWYGMSALARIQRDIKEIVPDYGSSFDKYHLFTSQIGVPVADSNAPLNLDAFTDEVAQLVGKRTGRYTCKEADGISYSTLLTSLKTNQMEDSVILMFTQYPPTSDKTALAELKKYLRAFRIKLNVLIGADDILLDCNSKKQKGAFDELTSLVHFTDGEIASFLVEDENDKNELLPAFIRASASPQSHSRVASTTCSSIGPELEFQTDPYPNTYYIAVRSAQNKPASISGTCSSGGEVSDPIPSYYNEFSIFTILSGAQQNCTIKVMTDTECVATVYSVGGEKGVDSFDIFHSFTTNVDMDTDSISSFQDEEQLFLTMHIEVPEDSKYKIKRFEGDVTVKNEIAQDVILESLSRRESTFEYQTVKPFTCPKNGASWILLNLRGYNNVDDKPVAVLNRMIHLNCEERTIPDPPAPKNFRLLDDEETSSRPPTTFAVMYSNQLPISQFSRFILESVNPALMESKFFKYGFLRFDAANIENFRPTTDFSQFRKDVYDNAPDIDIPYLNTLNKHLEQLTSEAAEKYRLTSDSLVSIAIQHSMTDPKIIGESAAYGANLNQLANLGAKLLFWGDVSTVKLVEASDTLEEYIRMAAVSAGHVILMDMDDFDDEDEDEPFYVSLALRDMYSFGPTQRLLAFSNLQWNQQSTTTSQSSSIGTLQVPEDTTQVFVSITLNVEDPSTISPAFMLSIVLEGTSDRQVLEIGSFKQYGPSGSAGTAKSNLYTANVTVVGGESYEGTFTILAMTPFTGAHIRFWNERKEEDVIPDITYVDFDQKSIQPDDYLGAALRVSDTGDNMTLRFYDENGVETKRLNHNQTEDIVNGVAHFVPYFCDSAQSDKLSKDTYTVELTYDSGFKYFRPLFCTKSTNIPKCPKADDGNSYCVESNPPFHRGPSKQLVDCSGVGDVVYTETKDPDTGYYKCNCKESFAGKSCEMSSCDAGINHLPEETDTYFRTLSYVLISPAGQGACSSLSAFYAKNAKELFNRAASYVNIWQYTFSVYFTDGTAKTLYRGSSFEAFYDVFGTIMVEDFDTENFCGNEKNKIDMDLNDVFNLAVESVGRDSRGIVFLYAAQTFDDQLEKNELYNAFASNELYQSIQAYQQHIYMVTPTVTPDFITMTTASGGFVVRILNEYDDKFDISVGKYQSIFDSIFNSQIGWAGVSTESKSRKWTVRKNAELLISSRTANEGENPVVTVPGGSVTVFSDNEDYITDCVSSHATINVGTDNEVVTVDITFDENTIYDLVQIVILTKDYPIRNALIGQGQANTDKHAAAATNTSAKAVHISFDQKSTDLFFGPTDPNWRQASRIDCSFAQEFVAFTQPFASTGAYVVDFDVSPMKSDASGPDEAKSFSLSVPLAVSESIDCVNGGVFQEGSYCDCGESGWSGPTCSQPSCGKGGRLNSHGDHCDCTGAEFGGLFCTGKKSSVGEADEE
ncbi:hypothetical protein PENTCL1PPCAC_11234 [Pristionchus entomophagus]|uniref:EGF-like domain-containing protein n=1 Tax=Pristionchus entomophagus TaxID=358040 RepID=A0AAV5T1F1_9BILA|nr:hypothetical protein PENTCL1PPCAC_11234 [Pristionchus entomophagus]